LRQYYKDPINGIPTDSGIYFWVYWPDFDSNTITVSNLETKLIEYSSKNLQFPEELWGRYKFIAEIKEQKFDKHSSPLFGLSPSQRQKLINYLSSSRNNIRSFDEFFKEICFTRPFYVGKANNLRSRLSNYHFKSTTEVIPEITRQQIPETQIWVGYKLIPMNSNDEMNNVFEEIISRNIKPGLTKKPN
jgi:hypothetical protein